VRLEVVPLFYRLRKNIANSKFNQQIKRILDTPPIKYKEAPLTIVSMVEKLDVQMYILAVKALYRRLGRGKIVSIVDADMEQSKRDLISKHLGPVEFRHLEDLDTGTCQRGGTWERVIFCVDRTAEDYVIQIDADVLCFGPVEEVIQCVEQNRAFTIAEGIPVQPLTAWVKHGEERKSDHIVNTFELKAKEFPEAEKYRYVRGSSGFAGFARGAVKRDLLETFHAGGQKVHGARWKEWGTEQIASNFTVANSPDSIPLPYPKYSTWEPEYATFQKKGITKDMSVLHFIGAFRFDLGVFPMLANQEIDAMLRGE
jgi:uncharacterized protein YbaR (Trm112 family)